MNHSLLQKVIASTSTALVLLSTPAAPANGISGPGDIAGLIAFYDARTLTNLTDGANVALWTDSSGLGFNDRDAAQLSPGNQPVYRANAFGTNFPAVAFQGNEGDTANSDYLEIPDSIPGLSEDIAFGFELSVFIALRVESTMNDNGAIVGADNGGLLLSLEGTDVGGGTISEPFHQNLLKAAIASAGPSTNDFLLDTPLVTTITWDSATSTVNFYVDGAADSGNPFTLAPSSFDSPRAMFLGSGNGSIRFFRGLMAAVVIYERLLTPLERADVESFLTTTYFGGGGIGPPVGPPLVPTAIPDAVNLVVVTTPAIDYRLQTATDPLLADWTDTPFTLQSNGTNIEVLGRSDGPPGPKVYRLQGAP